MVLGIIDISTSAEAYSILTALDYKEMCWSSDNHAPAIYSV